MMDNPPEERPVTISLSLSDITYVHVVSVSVITMTSDTFLCTQAEFKMKTWLEKKQTCNIPVHLRRLQYFHELSSELAFIQSHNHRDTD